MNKVQKSEDQNLDISPEDAVFLKQLGFKEEFPEVEDDFDEEIWPSYIFCAEDHPFIDDLMITVNIPRGFITVSGPSDEDFIKKPFERKTLLAIMKFLGLSAS